MKAPLSKREWALYRELKQRFLENKNQEFDLRTYHKYEEWLELLKAKGVLWSIRADGAVLCGLDESFDDFEEWIHDIDKKSKRMNRREWIIAIISATIGAVIGLIPYIVKLLF